MRERASGERVRVILALFFRHSDCRKGISFMGLKNKQRPKESTIILTI